MATWNIDPAHTAASFAVRHMMVSTVRSDIKASSGIINFDPENPTASSVEVTLDPTSIDTGVEDRDNHLKSGDFLDVEKFPAITFKSSKVEVTGESEGKIIGDLTIRDVTKAVTLDVEFLGKSASPFGTTNIGFEASTKINREDFGLTWNVPLETGGVLVGKDIKITIDAEGILAA